MPHAHTCENQLVIHVFLTSVHPGVHVGTTWQHLENFLSTSMMMIRWWWWWFLGKSERSWWDCHRDKIAHKLTQRLYKSASCLVLGDCKPVGRIKTQTAFSCLSLPHVFGVHRNWQKWFKPHFFHFHLVVCNWNTSCKTHQGSMDIFVQQSGDSYLCSHAVSSVHWWQVLQSSVFHPTDKTAGSWIASMHHTKLECIKVIEIHVCLAD